MYRPWWVSGLLAVVWPATAAQLTLQVQDHRGSPLELRDTVVYLVPETPQTETVRREQAPIAIEQRDRAFVPQVSVTRTGSRVQFPNRDDFNHHVYSFSATQPFELPLYKGDTIPEITTRQSGEIVIGCNIHDWMIGFLLVVDTPYFAASSTGRWAFSDLPPGRYGLRLWHPRITQGDRQSETIEVTADGNLALTRRLRHALLPASRQAPTGSQDEEHYF